MDRLLGHLAQFGSFSQQGELLCTQGLAYLLRDAEGERVFTDLISRATGHSLGPGLSWQAEPRQEDQGRPDLEGRNAEGQPVVKIEAKLGAPFGQGQLESYVSALCAGGQGGTLLIVVPKSRLEEITGHASAHFGIAGAGPWRILREAVEIPCSVVTWEDLLEALSTVASERFRDDLSQFRAMYRVFNGDDMEPLTSDEQVLAWRDREAWWGILVEHATRALTAPAIMYCPSAWNVGLSHTGGGTYAALCHRNIPAIASAQGTHSRITGRQYGFASTEARATSSRSPAGSNAQRLGQWPSAAKVICGSRWRCR